MLRVDCSCPVHCCARNGAAAEERKHARCCVLHLHPLLLNGLCLIPAVLILAVLGTAVLGTAVLGTAQPAVGPGGIV